MTPRKYLRSASRSQSKISCAELPANGAPELLDWLELLLAEDIPPEAPKSGRRKKIIPSLHGALLKNGQDAHCYLLLCSTH
jgi:hypothetical protein